MARLAIVCTLLLCVAAAEGEVRPAGAVEDSRSGSLLQAWSQDLDGATGSSARNPIWRVVGLLKDMRNTLQKEQDEDQEHYDKLRCWCNSNGFEKTNAISDQEAKVEELEASIESLTAKSEGLKTRIGELNKEVADDKAALEEATELRQKQLKEFHKTEVDSIQAIENMKSALTVLAKHEEGPDSTVGGGAVFKSESDSWSLMEIKSSSRKDEPWSASHEATQSARSLDDFMRRNGFDADTVADRRTPSKFLQHDSTAMAADSTPKSGWSTEDTATVKTALRSASAFMQAHHGYYPAYQSQSGEIVGLLKQMKDEMEADLAEAQKRETARASSFAELRSAKTSEIENGEKMSEQKEDEYATTKNDLAEAKEDVEQVKTALEETKKFMKTLQVTCKSADKDFEERKAARLEEMKAVSETIEILVREDKTREAHITTYGFLQMGRSSKKQKAAATLLRKVALAQREPRLSALATSVELDAFVKVKKAIDDMVSMLKVEMEDEVKKYDYCNKEIQQNEIATTKAEDKKADLQAKSDGLATKIKTLEDEILNAKKEIAQLQMNLQKASEDRKLENMEFQRVIGEQTITIEVLKKALTKLSMFYNEEFFLQRSKTASKKQLPADPSAPPPQMEYSKSKAASGVMEMIEKLIKEAKQLRADSTQSEKDSQAAYEDTVTETNDSVATLQQEISTKKKVKAETQKDKLQTDADIEDTVKEIEGLTKYNADLHGDCDYLLKNFNARQEARTQEIEALQQAKQILSGASFS